MRKQSRLLNLSQMIADNKCEKVKVKFDRTTWLPVGDNQKYYPRAVGVLVRKWTEPIYQSWAKVPEEQREQVPRRMRVIL